MNNNFVCDEHYQAMIAMMYGILDAATVKSLEYHISNCLPCREYYKDLCAEEAELRKAFKIIADRAKVIADRLIEQLSCLPREAWAN